ncbi:MAG TPA: AbrB/MazE/SpoVT family DNA-binding domain-containing protein [archaeon]|nr:AbrB/MazE/SpoVT family DNA-binding domain-containing protein [archaeon]
MVSTVVTRSGQITLNKEFRKELGIKKGDKIIENIEGKRIIISKRDIKVFEKAKNFLPANFSKTLEKIRSDSTERFKELELI